MKYSSNKEIEVFVRHLVKEGWSYRRGGKHGQLRAPVGWPAIPVPCTPSDRRAFLNFRRDVRLAARLAGMR